MIGPLMPAPNMDYRIDYMATVQSRHCIVIGDNQIFCLQRSDEWVEILDKDIQNSNCHACFKWGLPCQTHSLCLLKSRKDPYHLALIQLNLLGRPSSENVRFRFDGHAGVLQFFPGSRADAYQDRHKAFDCAGNSVQQLRGIPKSSNPSTFLRHRRPRGDSPAAAAAGASTQVDFPAFSFAAG